MSYFEINDQRITGDVIADGVVIPYGNLLIWPDEDLSAYGISKHEDPLAVEPLPETISDRQFFQALALQGTITQAEAIAAVATGTIPAALRGFIDVLNGAEAFAAEMLLSGATEFRRHHPLTVAIGQAQGMTPEQIDAFFQFAVTL